MNSTTSLCDYCSGSHYYISTDQTCNNCPANCSSCSLNSDPSSVECTQCHSNFLLSSTTQTCLSCPSNCSTALRIQWIALLAPRIMFSMHHFTLSPLSWCLILQPHYIHMPIMLFELFAVHLRLHNFELFMCVLSGQLSDFFRRLRRMPYKWLFQQHWSNLFAMSLELPKLFFWCNNRISLLFKLCNQHNTK
jgi:hypothetical protein